MQHVYLWVSAKEFRNFTQQQQVAHWTNIRKNRYEFGLNCKVDSYNNKSKLEFVVDYVRTLDQDDIDEQEENKIQSDSEEENSEYESEEDLVEQQDEDEDEDYEEENEFFA